MERCPHIFLRENGADGRRGAGRKDADRRFEGGAAARGALSGGYAAAEIARHIQIT